MEAELQPPVFGQFVEGMKEGTPQMVPPSRQKFWHALTLPTFQPLMSPLKKVAPKSMEFIEVTLATFQPLMTPLNEVASLNMSYIAVTLPTFQPLILLLKEVAP
jgi:hypothetical protein